MQKKVSHQSGDSFSKPSLSITNLAISIITGTFSLFGAGFGTGYYMASSSAKLDHYEATQALNNQIQSERAQYIDRLNELQNRVNLLSVQNENLKRVQGR